MSLLVAIASEFDDYDGEVYRTLLELMLGAQVTRWQSDYTFRGWKRALALANVFLTAAERAGVRHALIAIDNDGGARRRPEHDLAHEAEVGPLDPDDGCAFCLLTRAVAALPVPLKCIVVPVQTLETWLLVLRGDELGSRPERTCHRRVLKQLFFDKPLPPVEERTALALAQVTRDGALDVLRQRSSFRLFESQLDAWR